MIPTFRRPLSLLLASIALLAAVLPAAAAAPVLGSDAAAPGGRLIVLWRDHAPTRVAISGVDRVVPAATAQRSIVVAKAGQAAVVARALRADPRVLAVVPDARIEATDWPADAPDDPRFGEQPDLTQIRVPQSWPIATGAGVVVAVIDTGVDLDHPDLDGVATVAPRNEITDTTDVSDGNGHGTHVAGTIFARTDNATGIAGIAPNATLMPIKVLGDDGSGDFGDLLDAVDWARLHGADIVNLSLGGALSASQAALYQSTFTVARSAGVLVVAASGNTSDSTLHYPAAFESVVSVAAVNGSDVVPSFSTFNAAVDIAAPGVMTLSTTAGGYQKWSGTSMASPHVAGGAALVWSARPGLAVTQLEAVLRTTSVDLGNPGRDDHYGHGRLDVRGALDASAVVDTTKPTIISRVPARDATGVKLNAVVTIRFSEPVNGISTTTLKLKSLRTGAFVPVAVRLSAGKGTATIDPVANLRPNERYTAYVLTGVTDLVGNKLTPSSWTFRTRP